MKTLRKNGRAVQAAARGRPVLIAAAHSTLKDVRALEHQVNSGAYSRIKCSCCGTTALVTASLKQPICIACGTPNDASRVRASVLTPQMRKELTANLSAVSCSHCQTQNILTASVLEKTVKASHNPHCVACGHKVFANKDLIEQNGDPAVLRQTSFDTPKLYSPEASLDDDDLTSEEIDLVDDTVMSSFGDDGANDMTDEDGPVVTDEFLMEMDVTARSVFRASLDGDGADEMTDLQGFDPENGDDPNDPLADVIPVYASAEDGDDFVPVPGDDDEGEDAEASFDDGLDEGLEDEYIEEEFARHGGKKVKSAPYLDDGLGGDLGDYDKGIGLLPDGSLAMNNGGIGNDFRVTPQNDALIANAEDDFGELPIYEGDGEDILDVANFDDTDDGLSFVSAGKRVVAMKGHTSIAVLTPERAGNNASVMHSEGFSNAVARVAVTSGLRKALAHFKFTPIRVPSVNTVRAERQIAAFKVQASAAEQERKRIEAECFAMAAAGLARGRFKGYSNPMGQRLTAQLSAMGVSNAKRITANLMQEAGIEYAKQLVVLASRLQQMSPKARKETADLMDFVDPSLEDMSFAGEEEEDVTSPDFLDANTDGDFMGSDDELTEFSPLEDVVASRLSRPARRVSLSAGYMSNDNLAAASAQQILHGTQRLSFGY